MPIFIQVQCIIKHWRWKSLYLEKNKARSSTTAIYIPLQLKHFRLLMLATDIAYF